MTSDLPLSLAVCDVICWLITATGFSARLSKAGQDETRQRKRHFVTPCLLLLAPCQIGRGMLHGVVVGTVMAPPFGSGMSHPGFSSDFLCMLVGAK